MSGPASGLRERLLSHAPHSAVEFGRTLSQARVSRRARRMYRRFVQPGDLVFDVGAHMGSRTSTFLALGARVVAIEPQESCVKALNHRYGSDERVAIVPTAVADSEREAELFVCTRATTVTTMSREWMTGRFSDYEWDRVQPIRTTTLDALIADHGVPAFCKIDVEGLELDVLRGLSRPLAALSIEFVAENLDATHHCLDRLSEIGFGRFTYSLGESTELASDPAAAMSREAIGASLDGFAGTMAWGDIFAMA